MEFIDEHYKNEPAGTESNIMQHLEDLSEQFLSYFPFSTEDPGGRNEWLLLPFRTVSANLKSRMIIRNI